MHAEAGHLVRQANLLGIALDDVLIHGDRMQGLGQRLGVVVLHGMEERAFQVFGMPGVLQIRGHEPLRQLMEHQIAHLIPLPFHPDVRHPFPLVDVAHFERTELLAP